MSVQLRVGCAREQTRVLSMLTHVPTEDREGLLSLMTISIHLIQQATGSVLNNPEALALNPSTGGAMLP